MEEQWFWLETVVLAVVRLQTAAFSCALTPCVAFLCALKPSAAFSCEVTTSVAFSCALLTRSVAVWICVGLEPLRFGCFGGGGTADLTAVNPEP